MKSELFQKINLPQLITMKSLRNLIVSPDMQSRQDQIRYHVKQCSASFLTDTIKSPNTSILSKQNASTKILKNYNPLRSISPKSIFDTKLQRSQLHLSDLGCKPQKQTTVFIETKKFSNRSRVVSFKEDRDRQNNLRNGKKDQSRDDFRNKMLVGYLTNKEKTKKILSRKMVSETTQYNQFNEAFISHFKKRSHVELRKSLLNQSKNELGVKEHSQEPSSPSLNAPRRTSQNTMLSRYSSVKKLDTKKCEITEEYKDIVVEQQEIEKVPSALNSPQSQQMVKRDYKKIRKLLVSRLHFLKRLKLTPQLLLSEDVFSDKAYQKPGSIEFFRSCRSNNVLKVEEALKENRFLVYDFDYIHLTALHWACKRGYIQVADLLLRNGADVDAVDLVGRTPLYFAIEYNHEEMVKLCLSHMASPWSTPTSNYNELTKEKKYIMQMLTKARKLHILLNMSSPNMRDEIWDRYGNWSWKI